MSALGPRRRHCLSRYCHVTIFALLGVAPLSHWFSDKEGFSRSNETGFVFLPATKPGF